MMELTIKKKTMKLSSCTASLHNCTSWIDNKCFLELIPSIHSVSNYLSYSPMVDLAKEDPVERYGKVL